MTYDQRTAKQRTAKQRGWDSSILGITQDDYDAMDDDERQEYMVDSLNRSADLLVETLAAFGDRLESSEKSELKTYANKIIAIARKR